MEVCKVKQAEPRSHTQNMETLKEFGERKDWRLTRIFAWPKNLFLRVKSNFQNRVVLGGRQDSVH